MDCNKTINFMKERRRMCDEVKLCMNCPLECTEFCDKAIYSSNFKLEEVQRSIEIVQKWSDEHPQKTYADDFFEKFPNAPKFQMGGHPKACREAVYGGECPMNEGNKDNNCFNCWNEPMEE